MECVSRPVAVAISQFTAPGLYERGLESASEGREVDLVLARHRRSRLIPLGSASIATISAKLSIGQTQSDLKFSSFWLTRESGPALLTW